MDLSIDTKLLDWATDRQRTYIDAINLHGGTAKAAKALGLHHKTLYDGVKSVKKKAAAHGYSPDHDLIHIIPEPYIARGHSTYYDSEGKPRQQWVKTRLDDQKWNEILHAAAAALAEELPREAPIPKPPQQNAKLANLYVLTDVHLGMLAWHEEGGANWDLKIAERTVTDCFMRMMDASPSAGTAIIAQLGDWFHSDGLVPVTPASGHVLDQDGRFGKMVRAGVRLCRRVVTAALLRHDKVVLLLAEGNHDPASSAWMQTMFAALYEDDPRVEVIETPLPYYAFQHGRTALFFHHGHKKKVEALPGLFAALYSTMWGDTTKRYGHTGHLHHLYEKEFPGVKMMQHPTISARDAYAARGGFLSERQATSITYHSDFGEVGRYTITPEMLS